MNETYIYIMCIATVIGLVAFVVLHKSDGVRQRVKVYGKYYYVTTNVYVEGKRVWTWVDREEYESEYLKKKESTLQYATKLYDNLTNKNGKN